MMKQLNSFKYCFFLFLFIPFISHAFSFDSTSLGKVTNTQDTTQKTHQFSKKRTWLVTGVHVLGYAGSLAGLASVWYKDFDRTKLHAFNDMDEWGGMDKCGHITTTWQLANFSFACYKWAGLTQKNAALIGSGFSLLYVTTLEFFDGYSAKWGFSFGDMGANILGSSLAYFRNTGRLKNFHLKYSWFDTKYPPYREDVLGKTIPQKMLKDYNGQSYWVSINMPQKWFREDRNNWLCFALGYSIDGFTGGKQNYFDAQLLNPPVFDRVGEFYFSIDIDFEKIHVKNKYLRGLLKMFNVIKFPAPAIGFTTKGKLLVKPIYL